MPARDKILITGSNGMLGTDLAEELSGKYDVSGIDLGAKGKGSKVREFAACDITDQQQTIKVVSSIKPKAVVHAAAWTDVDACELDKEKAFRINAEGTENVALACGKAHALLIYISTDFVFDGRSKKPYRETDRTDPLNTYGESKLLGEDAVRRILVKHFIIRTSWLYGASGKNFVDTIIAEGARRDELKVVDDQAGSPTYTRDFAKAVSALIARICEGPKVWDCGSGTYHVTNSGCVSWYDYARTIVKLSGLDTKVRPISSKDLNRPARRPAYSALDNSKFVKFTGIKLRDWKSALKDYISKKG